MRIREFIHHYHLEWTSRESTAGFSLQGDFSAAESDLFISSDRKLLIAINRETGRFIAQQAENCVVAFVIDELTTEQIKLLTSDR